MADAGVPNQPPALRRHQHQPGPVRSITSRQQSFVRFVNRTQRTVDVFWINYESNYQKYKTLPPGAEYKVNTYVTHPWVFRDSETSATLLANNEEVFYPKPLIPEGHALYGPISPYRVTVYITIPLYTLKERAAQVVRSCLHDLEKVNSLDIPKILKSTIVGSQGKSRQ